MKNIPAALQSAYDKPGTSVCFLVKIVRRDGGIDGFCSVDKDITMFDGIDTVTYDSAQELRPQNIQQELNYEPDNTDLLGWFGEDVEKRVLAGIYNSAEVTIYRVAYLNLSAGVEFIASGIVGAIDFSADGKGKRKIEYNGLTKLLSQTVNESYSLTCRNQFGDYRCGMPFVWSNATITEVGANAYMTFKVAGGVAPDGYYDFGVIKVLTGDNAGADKLEVEQWLMDGTVQLSFLAAYPFKVGDQLQLRRDCGKTAADCIAYNNIINMNAEHLTPVQDKSIMVPGAYIKSVGSQ